MTDLLILGVGPHAVEMLDIVERINRNANTWNVLGFASVDVDRAGQSLLGLPVLGVREAMERYPEAFVIPEYDWPDKAQLPRHRLASLIDPSVFVSRTAHIGLGCVIYPDCYVGSGAQVGDFLFCLSGSVINHNDTIGDRVTLTSGVVIAGDVHVEDDCYLGQSSSIRELLTIGRGSLIGMGSVVVRDVAPNSVMVGNPARRLRARESKHPGVRVVRVVRRMVRTGARALYHAWPRARARVSAVGETASESLEV